MYRTFAAAMCAALLAFCRPISAADAPVPLASLSLTTEANGTVDVPVQIDGHSVNLRLDTGIEQSELTDSGATSLGLPRDRAPYPFWAPLGERDSPHQKVLYAFADTIRFDHFDARSFFTRSPRFLIVPDGLSDLPPGTAGKLGAEILRNYDIELDIPHGELKIYSWNQCANIWPSGTATELAMDVRWNGQIFVDVQLDGKPTTALMETGYPVSVLPLSTAKDMFGFSEKTPGLTARPTRNGAALLSYPFKTLSFQGLTIANPDFEIPTSFPLQPGMIIGANILRQLHVCIAYDGGQGKLYVALPAAN